MELYIIIYSVYTLDVSNFSKWERQAQFESRGSKALETRVVDNAEIHGNSIDSPYVA